MSVENEVLELARQNKSVLVLDLGNTFVGWPGHYSWGHAPKVTVTDDNILSDEDFVALMNVAVVPGPKLNATGLHKLLSDVMKHPAGPPHVLVVVGAKQGTGVDDSIVEWTLDKEVRVYK